VPFVGFFMVFLALVVGVVKIRIFFPMIVYYRANSYMYR